ncbi:hypothetical protein OsI_18120 [Oryza sativa Indica Group]|uniref:RRM domain-containing protein n=1 Tax=Oryza sativa subsp. indica TaxID=39946 RepID=B8AWW3_ORYSI|nr:hypothetical protein OsI_18120 [Oryza sativa Indica Group]
MATKPRRRSPSLPSSSSTSYSRSPASPSSFSSSPSRSRSLPRPAGGARSPSPPPPPPPPRKASPPPESTVLHVDHLSRNVNEDHLKEIFENYGEVVNVELSMDRVVNLPRGYGYVEFKNRADAEKALLYLDGGQIDGNVVKVRFALPPQQQRAAASPKALHPSPKRDVVDHNKVGPSAEKATKQQPRKPASPQRKPAPSPRRRSPPSRRVESPRRRPDSPPIRRRTAPSPIRRGGTPSRRPGSPIRRRSPSPPPRRLRSPKRLSPRRDRGSPIRRRSPLPRRRL